MFLFSETMPFAESEVHRRSWLEGNSDIAQNIKKEMKRENNDKKLMCRSVPRRGDNKTKRHLTDKREIIKCNHPKTRTLHMPG